MRITTSLTALALALLPGAALAADHAALTRIDAATVELTRPAAGPAQVWVSADTALDDADKLVAKESEAKALRVALPSDSRAYVIVKDAAGTATVIGERMVPLAQGSNFRDIGGYEAADGKHVRWGRIYRSGATPLLTDADLQQIKSLGLADMVDLRSSEERVLAPTRIAHVPYTAIGYSMTEMMPLEPAKLGQETMGTLYGEMPGYFAPHVKVVFAKLLRAEGPLVYNCSAGQDRTGFVTAMVLSALGVPRATILQDYHLSTELRRPEYEMPKIDIAMHRDNPVAQMFGGHASDAMRKPSPLKTADGTAYLAKALDAIDQRWGSVEAYLEKEAGVGPAQLARLRSTYLD
jgi:protein-tyrosine phosphatase